MKNRMTFSETVREALALALLQLMKKKPFAEITISEIAKVAGVSRSSFYRNYSNKEHIFFDYIRTLYSSFFENGSIPQRMEDPDDYMSFLLPRFGFIKQHRTIFSALNDNNMLHSFFRQTESDLILLLCGQNEKVSPYHRAMCSGACAGIVRLWIENGFKETEEEMVTIFADEPTRSWQ